MKKVLGIAKKVRWRKKFFFPNIAWKNKEPSESEDNCLWVSNFYPNGKVLHYTNKFLHFLNLPEYNNSDYRMQINEEIGEYFYNNEKISFEKKPIVEKKDRGQYIEGEKVPKHPQPPFAKVFSPKIKIESVVHRYGEKGIFITFKDSTSAQRAKEIIEKNNGEFVREKQVNTFFVKGIPYLEDIITRSYSSKLIIELPTDKISEENIYNLFRPFGAILRLIYDVKSKTVEIQYVSKQVAVNARNCLHRADVMSLGKINIKFLKFNRWRVFFDLLKSPKMIPLMMIIFILVFILIIDPLRLMNMIRVLSGKKKKVRRLGSLKEEEIAVCFTELINELRTLLDSKKHQAHVISLTGSRGCGKSTIVSQTTNNRRMVSVIDCKDKNLKQFVLEVENALGFRPSFSTLNKTIGYITSIFPAKGVELVSSEGMQIQTILKVLETSCRAMGTLQNKKPIIVFDSLDKLFEKASTDEERKRVNSVVKDILHWTNVMAEKNYATVILTGSLLFHMNYIKSAKVAPKVVHIDIPKISKKQALEFLKECTIEVYKEELRNRGFFSRMRSEGNAFMSENFGFFRILKSYFKGLNADKKNSEWIKKKREEAKVFSERQSKDLNAALMVIGTQMSSLKNFVTRYRNSKSVKECVEKIVKEKRDEVLNKGFGSSYFAEDKSIGWSKIVFFKAITLLSKKEKVKYEDMVLNIFKGNKKSLNNLIKNNLLDLRRIKDDLYVVPHDLSMLHAFKSISGDREFAKRMKSLEDEINLEKAALREERLGLNKPSSSTCSIL